MYFNIFKVVDYIDPELNPKEYKLNRLGLEFKVKILHKACIVISIKQLIASINGSKVGKLIHGVPYLQI